MLSLLLACTSEQNPVNTQTGEDATVTLVAPPSAGLTHSRVELEVVSVIQETCPGSERPRTIGQDVDILAGETLPLWAGDWCHGISVEIDDYILEGIGDGGSAYLIQLTFPEIRLIIDDVITLDGDALTLELGLEDWVTAESLALSEGDVAIGAVHWMHSDLADVIARQSLLYADTDESGTYSDGDALVAAGFDREE